MDWNALVRDRRDQILACTDPEGLKSGQSGGMEGKVELEYPLVRAVRIEPSNVRSWFPLRLPVHFLATILQLLNNFFFVRVPFYQHVQVGTGNKVIDRRRLDQRR